MTTEVQPVVVTVEVALPVEEAFRLFTEQMHTWWPLSGPHSIGGEKVAKVEFELCAGGRVFERWHDGSEADWADVLEWEPPHRLRLAWHPNDTGLSTDVEVAFATTDSGTEIVLTHRGWEVLGTDAPATRDSYASGWVGVLDLFRRAA